MAPHDPNAYHDPAQSIGDAELKSILADPRWHDPTVQKQVAQALGPEQFAKLVNMAPPQEDQVVSNAKTLLGSHGAMTTAGALTGMAGTALLPEVGVPLWLMEALGGGLGAAAGGQVSSAVSNEPATPGSDFAGGAAGPLIPPALRGTGKVLSQIPPKVGAAAGWGIEALAGHPWSVVGPATGAGLPKVAPGIEAAGNTLEQLTPANLVRRVKQFASGGTGKVLQGSDQYRPGAFTNKAAKIGDSSGGSDQLGELMDRLHPGETSPRINPNGHGEMPNGSPVSEPMPANVNRTRTWGDLLERLGLKSLAGPKNLEGPSKTLNDLMERIFGPGDWEHTMNTSPAVHGTAGDEPSIEAIQMRLKAALDKAQGR